MRKEVKYAHIAWSADKFGEKFLRALESFNAEGFSTNVHYAQSTGTDGIVIYSALIIGERTVSA
ncbi:hypothetical protein [Paenibacillus xylanilyticus]|uniref:hypothetical protein n=1 Tax=Paenibacillus xylanilyticus TaxID=248903 RepID=UPI003AB05E19